MDYLAKRIIEKLKARGDAEQQRAEEWQRSLKPTIYRGNNLFQELGGEPIEGRYLGQVGLVPGQSVPNIGRNPNKPVIPGLPLPPAEEDSRTAVIQKTEYVSAGVLPFQSENFEFGTAYDLVAIINGDYITLGSFDEYKARGFDRTSNSFPNSNLYFFGNAVSRFFVDPRNTDRFVYAWLSKGDYFFRIPEDLTFVVKGDSQTTYGLDYVEEDNLGASTFLDYNSLEFTSQTNFDLTQDYAFYKIAFTHAVTVVGINVSGNYTIVKDSDTSAIIRGGAGIQVINGIDQPSVNISESFAGEFYQATDIFIHNSFSDWVGFETFNAVAERTISVSLSFSLVELIPAIGYYDNWIHLDNKGWIIWYSFYELNTHIQKRNVGLDGMEYGREWLYGFAGKGSIVQSKRIYIRKYNSDETIEYFSDIDDVITPFSETAIIPEDFRENSKSSRLEWSGQGVSNLLPSETNYRGKIFRGNLSEDAKIFSIIIDESETISINVPENLDYADYIDLVNTGFDFQLVFT